MLNGPFKFLYLDWNLLLLSSQLEILRPAKVTCVFSFLRAL